MTGDTNANIAAMAAGGSDEIKTGLVKIINNSDTRTITFRLQDSDFYLFKKRLYESNECLVELPVNVPLYMSIDGGTTEEQYVCSGVGDRTIYVGYNDTAYKNGIFIQTVSGKLYTVAEWTGQDTPNGIAVITNSHSFVIGLNDVGQTRWSNDYSDLAQLTNFSDNNYASDLNGVGNTDVMINFAEIPSPAAKACADYTFPNGQKGYLGAAGEWSIVCYNIAEINEALEACGETTAATYWTSSEWGSNYAFGCSVNSKRIYYSDKGSSYKLRPFTTL